MRCLAARYGLWPNEHQYLNLVFGAKDQTPIQDSSSSPQVLIPPVSCLQWRKTTSNRCQLRHLLLNHSLQMVVSSLPDDCMIVEQTVWLDSPRDCKEEGRYEQSSERLNFDSILWHRNSTMPHSLKSSSSCPNVLMSSFSFLFGNRPNFSFARSEM